MILKNHSETNSMTPNTVLQPRSVYCTNRRWAQSHQNSRLTGNHTVPLSNIRLPCLHQYLHSIDYIRPSYILRYGRFLPMVDIPVCEELNNYISLNNILQLSIKYAKVLTKRRRSDSVLWQKPLHPRKCQKGSDNTNNATKKFD